MLEAAIAWRLCYLSWPKDLLLPHRLLSVDPRESAAVLCIDATLIVEVLPVPDAHCVVQVAPDDMVVPWARLAVNAKDLKFHCPETLRNTHEKGRKPGTNHL